MKQEPPADRTNGGSSARHAGVTRVSGPEEYSRPSDSARPRSGLVGSERSVVWGCEHRARTHRIIVPLVVIYPLGV